MAGASATLTVYVWCGRVPQEWGYCPGSVKKGITESPAGQLHMLAMGIVTGFAVFLPDAGASLDLRRVVVRLESALVLRGAALWCLIATSP